MKKINLIVCIDDNPATNYYHEIIIRDSGTCEASVSYTNPEEGLLYFEELATQKDPIIPEIIFLDINIPRMDGWEFLEKFCNISLPQQPLVIMLTTSLSPADREKAAFQPLVYNVLAKPLTEEHLKNLQNILETETDPKRVLTVTS